MSHLVINYLNSIFWGHLVIFTRSKLNNLRFTFLIQNKRYPTVFTDYLTVWSLIEGERKEWNSERIQRLLLYGKFTHFLWVSNLSWDNFSSTFSYLGHIYGRKLVGITGVAVDLQKCLARYVKGMKQRQMNFPCYSLLRYTKCYKDPFFSNNYPQSPARLDKRTIVTTVQQK